MAAPRHVVREDRDTMEYFEAHEHEYGVERLEYAAEFVRTHAQPGASLIDLGCGVGNTLAYLRDSAGIADVVGVDVSENCVLRTRERVGCETHRGSVFDSAFLGTIGREFDFAVLAAVLHHLIGRTRSESRSLAESALHGAASLLKPGGHLIVLEPIFSPAAAMSALFYVKKAVSRVSAGRVGIGGYWNNIGAPVVSYYTNERLEEMVASTPGLSLVARDIQPDSLSAPLDRVLHKTSTTLVARRNGPG